VPERLHDARVSIHLSPLPAGRGTALRRAPSLVAIVRWESVLHPKFRTRRFTCVSNIEEFRALKQDTAATSAWYVGRRTGLDAADPQTFELLEFTVDGEPRRISRSGKEGSQTYSVNLGAEALDSEERVTIAYTYRTLIAADEHLLQIRVDQPTRGLAIEIDYTATDFDHVNVLDFIAGNEATRISRSPSGTPEKVVGLQYDGWVFPRSGAAFVWPHVVLPSHGRSGITQTPTHSRR
jgi:hypothetical protein